MAEHDTQAPRWDTLHELLARAQQLHLSVSISIHGVPTEDALDWLQHDLLDGIERGAQGNPPTGRMLAGDRHGAGLTEAVVFTEAVWERERRIGRQENEALAELAAEIQS